MLSLPSSQAAGAAGGPNDPAQQGLWGYLTPKRSQALVARESSVASREAEVARREAELLAGAPGGVLPNQSAMEVLKEAEALTPPGWWDQARVRAEDILDRELKIAEREREISRREEAVNRREHDASRRESWIMEQLVALNNEEPTVEEEYIYEPASPKRKPKAPLLQALPPPIIYTETAIEIATETKTVTQVQHYTESIPARTVTVPPPANTRGIASPAPSNAPSSATSHIPRTTAVEVIVEEVNEPSRIAIVEDEPMRTKASRKRKPKRWLGVW
ncbi:unnamed protein product [Somion occarium]|uniref:Uncharacterized protein n=1 Tax=Somion occarium TaxID=3059160 RepID=A0ABP1DB43_9APHY